MKLNYIDWYLVELRRRLIDSMPLDQESSFILETRNHLESLTEEFVTNGMDQRAAEVAAIERFGTPDKIASDCILGIRRKRERRLIQFAGIMLAIWTTDVVWDGVSNLRGYPFGYTYSLTLAPLIILFGLYSLVLGKLPSRAWYALPATCIVAFGIYSGIRSTFYAPPNTFGAAENYRELHDHYGQLREQHLIASKMEHETAEAWRAMLPAAKDMKSGQTLEIPRIVYQESRHHVAGYDFGQSPTIVDDETRKATFRYMPVEKKLELMGPLTAHDVRSTLLGRIREVQSRGNGREATLIPMQRGLNISVRNRIKTFVSGPLAIYMFIIGPLSLLASFLTSKVRNRIRFREKNLRLA